MKQIKFDKNGFIFPQKIKNKIEHDEETEAAIKNAGLEKEILRGLKILASEDRHIKPLTIWCNPNYCNGPDYKIQKKIKKILGNLIENKIVIQEKSKKNRIIFSLINLKNMKKTIEN